MYQSVLLTKDESLYDATYRFGAINKILGQYVGYLAALTGLTVISDNNPSDAQGNNGIKRSIGVKIPGINRGITFMVGGHVSYNYKYIRVLIDKVQTSGTLVSSSYIYYNSTGTVSCKAFIKVGSGIFNTYAQTSGINMFAVIPLSDGQNMLIWKDSGQVRGVFDDSDTVYILTNGETSYNLPGSTDQEYLIPLRIKNPVTNKLLDARPTCLYKFGNIGNYPIGSLLSDGGKIYTVMSRDDKILIG